MKTGSLASLIVFVCISLFTCDVYSQKTDQEASSIIDFTNSVIDLNNAFYTTYRNYEDYASYGDRNLKGVAKDPKYKVSEFKCTGMSDEARKISAYETEVKKVPAFTGKEDVKEAVREAIRNNDKLKATCSQLNDYFVNQLYKTDERYDNYYALVDTMIAQVNATSASWKKASRLASKSGSLAELFWLKKSPAADFSVPMRIDLTSLDEILDLASDRTVDVSVVNEKVTALSASIEKNKSLTGKRVAKLKDPSYQNIFTEFYDDCAKCIVKVNDFTKLVTEKGPEGNLKSAYSAAKSAYEMTTRSYNTFINQ